MYAEKHSKRLGKMCFKQRSNVAWNCPAVSLNVSPVSSKTKIKYQCLDFQCNLIWQAPQKQWHRGYSACFYSMLWKREDNSLEMSLNKVTSAFGINLTLHKVQPGECLLLFLGPGEAGGGFPQRGHLGEDKAESGDGSAALGVETALPVVSWHLELGSLWPTVFPSATP